MNNEKRLEKVIEKLWLVFIIIIFAELFFIIMLYIILNMCILQPQSVTKCNAKM